MLRGCVFKHGKVELLRGIQINVLFTEITIAFLCKSTERQPMKSLVLATPEVKSQNLIVSDFKVFELTINSILVDFVVLFICWQIWVDQYTNYEKAFGVGEWQHNVKLSSLFEFKYFNFSPSSYFFFIELSELKGATLV